MQLAFPGCLGREGCRLLHASACHATGNTTSLGTRSFAEWKTAFAGVPDYGIQLIGLSAGPYRDMLDGQGPAWPAGVLGGRLPGQLCSWGPCLASWVQGACLARWVEGACLTSRGGEPGRPAWPAGLLGPEMLHQAGGRLRAMRHNLRVRLSSGKRMMGPAWPGPLGSPGVGRLQGDGDWAGGGGYLASWAAAEQEGSTKLAESRAHMLSGKCWTVTAKCSAAAPFCRPATSARDSTSCRSMLAYSE